MTATSGPAQPPASDVPDWIRADTVEALVTTVRSLLRDEDAREQSVTGRTVGLSGFSGLIVSVVGPLSAAFSSSSHLRIQWTIAVVRQETSGPLTDNGS